MYVHDYITFQYWLATLQLRFINESILYLEKQEQYAVRVQRSLAPLSWFPGSRKPTAHVHQ